MSFRTRLVLSAAYLLTAVVLALEIPLALNVERRASSEFESAAVGSAAVLGARVADLVAAAGDRLVPRPRLDAVVQETAAARPDARIVVTDERGRVLSDSAREAALGTAYATPERPELGAAIFEGRIDVRRRESETLGERLLLVTVPVIDSDQVVGAVRISEPTSSVAAKVRRSWLGLALIGAIVVLAGLVLAWLLATTLARPVRRLGESADRLGRGDLEARATPEGPREIASLGVTFNRMADALASNLVAQRDFLANASHQLRTPLTGLKLRLEAIRAGGGPAGEEAAKAEQELDRLSGLVDDLLALARATTHDATGRTTDLADVARQAADRWSAPAAEGGKRLRLEEDGSVLVWADGSDLAQALDNLIENAIRYTPEGTEITLGAGAPAGVPTLVVADTGPGIAPEERARVFERFYRGESGRRAGRGTGLGLAIAAELVHRWGGRVVLADGAGTRIEATFPASDGSG